MCWTSPAVRRSRTRSGRTSTPTPSPTGASSSRATPTAASRALKKHEATGIDQMMIMMQTETIPHEKVMRSIELFGKYVIPEFKKTEAAAAAGD